MTHSYVCHASFTCRHDSFICVTCLIHMCDMTHSYVWHDSFMCATWPIRTCDMTHSYVWHDSFTCVTWPIHTCDANHPFVCHDSSIRATWPIHVCDMTHSCVWHDSFMCVTWGTTWLKLWGILSRYITSRKLGCLRVWVTYIYIHIICPVSVSCALYHKQKWLIIYIRSVAVCCNRNDIRQESDQTQMIYYIHEICCSVLQQKWCVSYTSFYMSCIDTYVPWRMSIDVTQKWHMICCSVLQQKWLMICARSHRNNV